MSATFAIKSLAQYIRLIETTLQRKLAWDELELAKQSYPVMSVDSFLTKLKA